MTDPQLADAFDRAERALERIERAVAGAGAASARETALREKVQSVVVELDELIRAAGAR